MKSLKNVHDKLCKGDIVYREPSEELLSEKDYPISVVEFEEMYDLMMDVSEEDIQQDQKEMLQDVMSYLRDTGMIDSYLLLETFTRGFHPALIAGTTMSTIIHDIIEDDYYTRDSKLFFIAKRVVIITNLIYKRNPLHLEKDNERYGDMVNMLSRMESSLKVIKARFDEDHEEEMVNKIIYLRNYDADICLINSTDTKKRSDHEGFTNELKTLRTLIETNIIQDRANVTFSTR